MSTIYVVEGSTGEYSDHSEWPVRAFRDEAAAQRLVVEAQARANEIFAKHGYTFGRKTEENEFDPKMCLDYTGTHYSYFPIELIEGER